MKNIVLISKVFILIVFGILGTLSLFMFPGLIGNPDTETSIIGYSYLGLLLTSFGIFYSILKNEIKPS